MNNKKKLIELLIYVTIVAIGIILLISSNAREHKNSNELIGTGGVPYAIVLDE